jgi:hypothetical protein
MFLPIVILWFWYDACWEFADLLLLCVVNGLKKIVQCVVYNHEVRFLSLDGEDPVVD